MLVNLSQIVKISFLEEFVRSLIYIKNSRELRIEPCGIRGVQKLDELLL